ncbi:heme ABC transporter permease [Salmonella enterica subsp. enterica]|uniref:Heme ABC transporter permease n=1 Tax=Salmonella enterica I TaxID=59201 RepID=A0A379WIC4_SALET|nr:heme ABC transporter permease [Salmonella enterica subsp. enterica]
MVLPDGHHPVSVKRRAAAAAAGAYRPGIIQVAALLASLLALERLFRDDLQDGSLEQLMLLPVPLPAVVLAKVLATGR